MPPVDNGHVIGFDSSPTITKNTKIIQEISTSTAAEISQTCFLTATGLHPGWSAMGSSWPAH